MLRQVLEIEMRRRGAEVLFDGAARRVDENVENGNVKEQHHALGDSFAHLQVPYVWHGVMGEGEMRCDAMVVIWDAVCVVRLRCSCWLFVCVVHCLCLLYALCDCCSLSVSVVHRFIATPYYCPSVSQ